MRPLSYTANQGVCAAVLPPHSGLLWNTYYMLVVVEHVLWVIKFISNVSINFSLHDSMSDTHADIKTVFLEVVRSLVRLVPPHHKATLKMKVGNYVQKKPGAAPHVNPRCTGVLLV